MRFLAIALGTYSPLLFASSPTCPALEARWFPTDIGQICLLGIINNLWPLFGVTVVAVAAFGLAVWYKRRQEDTGAQEGENPFQPIRLNPLAQNSRPSELEGDTTRFGNPRDLRKIVGELPPASDTTFQSQKPTAENFIYAAAHDLREPLRKVRLLLNRFEQKLTASDLNPVQTEVDGIRLTVNRMQSLLDSLLSLARIEGKGMMFELVDLATVLGQVMGDLETCITETQAEITLEGNAPQLAADRTQLQQLLQNLISNALKFHKEGQAPKIRIETTVFQERPVNDHPNEKGWCEISIRDEGIGFEEEYWDRMLQGFQRLHSRDRYEGTGLGLAICRCIVERHRGLMTAESRPGDGTTIRIRLPLQQHARSGDTTILIGPKLGNPEPSPQPVEGKQF